ncbi:hypothetical protein KGF54_004063 [Candida jiufengensis]|uniref:uncharacterized protein n=1 Tax=Candida jiufengensis TaxID=497108 RepID=UPI00222489FC|nr:uncharacterized protein KGF54_004063 [Candida jiufengensis]KAI5950989.1 hypothetical protein KGF54_004063 [Candida jiufengensis]
MVHSEEDNSIKLELSLDDHPNSNINKIQSPVIVTTGKSELQTTTRSIGIRKIEVLNSQFDNRILKVLFFFSVFIASYAYGLDAIIRGNLQVYATSSYNQHALFSTVSVMQSVISAAGQPFYARLSDKFGRLELYLTAMAFYIIGTILQSQAYDINIFAAGSVLYTLGITGMVTIILIMMGDFSNLNWRVCVNYIPGITLVINTWISGDIVSAVILTSSWNWGIGMWAFISPLASLPLIGFLVHMLLKAKRTEKWKSLMVEEKELIPYSKKTLKYWRNLCINLFWDLDVVGLLLLVIVLGFILVPFTLAGGTSSKWARASTIAPLSIGVTFLPLFFFWERKVAKSPIMPFALMKDRGVYAALLIAIFVNFIWYMPNDFMYTVLVVGMNASVKAATRITKLYTFVGCIVGPLVGLVVVKVRRVKAFIIFGCSCWAVALGILFHFRGANDGIESEKYLNGVIGGLCLMGFGAGFLTYSTQVSLCSVTNHEYMGIIISIHLSCYYIGSALGNSVSGAIWTNKMHGVILENMEQMNISNATALASYAYGSPFEFILDNTWGSPERIAVVVSYAEVQKYLCIAGLVLCIPMIIFPFLLRDHKLESVQSLEMSHDHENQGIQRNGAIVVNNYDDDPILKFIIKMFKFVFRRS